MTVRELIVKLKMSVDKGSFSGAQAAIDGVKRSAGTVAPAVSRVGTAVSRVGRLASGGFGVMRSAAVRTAGTMSMVSGAISGIMAQLGPLGAAIAGAFAVNSIIDTADEMMNLDGRLRTVTNSEQERYGIEDQLYKMSQDNRQSLSSMGDLYYKVARGAKQFGVSQDDAMRVTDVVSKALTVGGASAQEAQASILQLGQALSSGVLQGDELHSLDENASLLMQHMAENMGVTIGDLKKMGSEGELTSTAVIQAILASGEAVDAEFGQMPMTIGQALQQVKNAWNYYTGMLLERKSGVFSSIAQGISGGLKGGIEGLKALATLSSGPTSNAPIVQAEYHQLQQEYPILAAIAEIWKTIYAQAVKVGEALGKMATAFAPVWEKLGPYVQAFLGMFVAGLQAIIEFIGFVITKLVEWVTEFMTEFPNLSAAILGIGAAILAYIFAPLLLVIALIGGIVYAFNWVRDNGTEAFQAILDAAANFINYFIEGAQNAWNTFTSAASGAIASVKQFFSDLYNYSVGIIQGIADAITTWIGSKIQWAVDKLNSLKSWAGGVSDSISSNISKSYSTAQQYNTFNIGSTNDVRPTLNGAGEFYNTI